MSRLLTLNYDPYSRRGRLTDGNESPFECFARFIIAYEGKLDILNV